MSELKLRPPKAAKLRRVRSICPIQLSKSNAFRPRQEGGWLQSAIVITLADCGACVKWLLAWTAARNNPTLPKPKGGAPNGADELRVDWSSVIIPLRYSQPKDKNGKGGPPAQDGHRVTPTLQRLRREEGQGEIADGTKAGGRGED